MRLFLSILLAFSFVAAIPATSMGQKLTKEEKKKLKMEKKLWKKKAKNYKKNPLQFKNDLNNLNEQIKTLSDKNKQLMGRISDCNAEVDSLRGALNSKLSEIAQLNTKYEKLQAAYEAQKNVNEKGITPGLTYTVQIGAFVHFDINKYLKETENFEGETADGMNKYLVGRFREKSVAENFKKDIQRLGIKDAWVVPYIDGVRVTMEEAEKYRAEEGS